MWRILGRQRGTGGGRQGLSGEVTGRGTPAYHQDDDDDILEDSDVGGKIKMKGLWKRW